MLLGKWQSKFPKWQSSMIVIGLIIAIITFILIRYLFPIPDYFPDTNEYISAAINKTAVSTRPIGYALFLRGIHLVSSNLTVVAWVQFILSEISCCWLSLLFLNLFKFKKKLSVCLVLLAGIDNVTFIYLSNTLFSDTLFTSVTLFCVASLLAAMNETNKYRGAFYFLLHLIFIWIALKTRYSAIYYPIATLLSIFWMAKPKWIKQLSMCFVVVLVSFFGYSAVTQFHKRTGIMALQGFSGLQWGNNAYETFRRQPQKLLQTNDTQLTYIQQLNSAYFERTDTARKATYAWLPIRELRVNYMWDTANPMKSLILENKKLYNKDYFTSWNLASQQLGMYGKAYVKQYPAAYIKYYIIPNNLYFFTPEIENFYTYCAEKCTLYKQNADYYHISTRNHNNNGKLIRPLLAISYIMYVIETLFAVVCIISLFIRKNWGKWSKSQQFYLFFALTLFLLTWGFMVLSAPVMYRYVAFLTLILVPLLAIQEENSFFLTKPNRFR